MKQTMVQNMTGTSSPLPEFPKWWGPSNWMEQLAEHPEDAAACPWHLFNKPDWFMLLHEQPQFADQFADQCDWSRLNGFDWSIILDWHPQFADRCNWNKLNGKVWSKLLQELPQFANHGARNCCGLVPEPKNDLHCHLVTV